jgi:hypothetical protein
MKETTQRVNMTFPLIQQGVVLTLAAMMLDFGQTLQVSSYAACAYWGGFIMIMVRRRRRLTGIDRILIRWGFLMLVPITGFVTGFVWHLRGFDF